MDNDSLRVVLIAVVSVAAVGWVALSLLVRVSGTWVRELSDEDRRGGERPETLELKSFGPLVSGASDVPGGRQEYSGYILFRTVFLRRRDHGVRNLQNQGYPVAIAEKRDGEEAARLKLRVAGATRLEGEFFPVKVEYTHQPPRVTQVLPMAPSPRAYTRLQAVPVDDAVPTERNDAEIVQG